MQSYHCKQIPFGLLHDKKMAEVVLLNVFRIGFSASLLSDLDKHELKKNIQKDHQAINQNKT